MPWQIAAIFAGRPHVFSLRFIAHPQRDIRAARGRDVGNGGTKVTAAYNGNAQLASPSSSRSSAFKRPE